MDWVDRPQNYKALQGILQLLQGSHLDNFPLKTLKLGWVAFHSSQSSRISAMGYGTRFQSLKKCNLFSFVSGSLEHI